LKALAKDRMFSSEGGRITANDDNKHDNNKDTHSPVFEVIKMVGPT